MSDKNKENIENNQEENQNKPEGNRNWWRKLLGLTVFSKISDFMKNILFPIPPTKNIKELKNVV